MKRRVLFYVQHLLGVGHLKRAELLADAMAAAGLDVTIAFGGRPLADVPFRNVSVAQLPPTTIANEDFSTLLDDRGSPVDADWKQTRRASLFELYRRIDPDVLLIELYPFGRRQFRFELEPLLECVRASAGRPRVACSVRDILVGSKKPGRDAEVTATLRRHFDAVFVHGDPALIPFGATFAEASAVADLLHYTGYVAADPPHMPPSGGADEVLVSAGGGAVGAPLLFAALRARPLTAVKSKFWRFIAGPNLPDELFAELAAEADHNTRVERFRSDFPARLSVAALSISQAGYNTTMDILRAGVRAVVVPYETVAETEQRLRSDILAAKGVLSLVPAAELSPQRLAAGIATALARPAKADIAVDLSGAATTARFVEALAETRATAEVTASSPAPERLP